MSSFAVQTIFGAVDKTSSVLGGISKNIESFQSKAKMAFANIIPGGKFFQSIAGQVAVGTLAVKGFTAAFNGLKTTVASVPQFAATADALGKQSQMLGIGAESLQRFNYAAAQSNVSQETMAKSIMMLNRSMGSGALHTSLEKLDKGLAAQMKTAKGTTEAFMILSDAVSKETNVAKRTAIMQAAFGKQGNALVPMMSEGSAGIMEQMNATPNVISNRAIATSTIFGNTMTEVKANIQSLTDTAKAGIVEAITPYVLAFNEWISANREFIKIKIQQFLQKTISLIERLRPVVLKAVQSMRVFINDLRPFIAWTLDNLPRIIPIVARVVGAFMGFNMVVDVIKKVQGAIAALQLVFMGGPMGIVFAVIAALIAGFIILANRVGGVGAAFDVIKDTAVAVGQAIQNAFEHPIQTIINYFLGLIETILEGFRQVLNFLGKFDVFNLIPNIDMSGMITGLNEMRKKYAPDVYGTFGEALTGSYKSARAEFLEKQAAEGEQDKTGFDDVVNRLNAMIAAQMKTTEAVEGLDGDSPMSPKNLRWGAMGTEDYWNTARLGL